MNENTERDWRKVYDLKTWYVLSDNGFPICSFDGPMSEGYAARAVALTSGHHLATAEEWEEAIKKWLLRDSD